jgi:hypothetical protein
VADGTTCDNGDGCAGDVCQAGVCQAAACGPAAPTGLTATFGKNVDLSWDANSEPDLKGYKVYRSSLPGGPYTLLGTRNHRQTSYTDRKPGAVSLCYVVTAFNKSGEESPYSGEVCGEASSNNHPNKPPHPHL